MDNQSLQRLAYQCLLDLASDDGINASGREEVFGCLFGRDAAISIIKILKAVPRYKHSTSVDTTRLLQICKHTLTSLASLQGKETNLESGEEPGKFVHEYRKDNYERLTQVARPWFIYPDGRIRNYDSIDSTPLGLIAFYRYWQVSHDNQFIVDHLPVIEKALQWMITLADKDNDGLVEYELPSTRYHGGLPVQSWTDSIESLLQADGSFPIYPIAPVEAQGYTWLALKLWSDYYQTINSDITTTLRQVADRMKKRFNEVFILKDHDLFYAAQALDGRKQQINTITGNPLLLLWASYTTTNSVETIVNSIYIPDIVKRSFETDLFDPDAGIRTMSTFAPTYNPGQDSYHNGSFWPKLNGMAHGGLQRWGFMNEATQLRQATLGALAHFQTPIELYIKNTVGELVEFRSLSGQTSCRTQAWTAAVMLELTAVV